AGIVLTLGMAVDANVLINERIREEVHRGASLWLAVRQGYDKVFWTIFDANTTTSLTSIVLIAVASEEVKGFGVTLLIGLMVHMFTALFVTRTLMMAAIKWGIMRQIDDHSIAEYLKEVFTLTWLRKGRWPFMRVITVTNFDWIGKRHYFWVVSALITLGGITAFFMRGDDKYDTEFNGGSQITFRVNQTTDIEVIRKRISVGIRQDLENDASKLRDQAKNEQGEARQLSENHAAVLASMARELEQARVVAVGNEGTKFQLVTTIAEKQQSNELQDRLINKFGDLLSVQRKISYRGADLPDATTLEQLQNNKLVYPISSSDLEKSVPGVTAADVAQNDVSNYVGGVALLLEDLSPPQTVSDMTARISNLRSKPDFATAQFREVKIIPVTLAPGEKAGTDAKVTKAVVIVSDPTISWSPEAEGSTATEDTNWTEKVAHTEWRLAQQALTSQSSLEGVTRFDAQVAGDAKRGAIVALVLSLLLILIYVWFRFGGLRYGAGAILSLCHDAIVALAATVLSGVFVREFPNAAHALLISDFKINLTMIAAYLT
ncbi:MAG: MMPL family transporter, partial [Phycisphaerae bacterium]